MYKNVYTPAAKQTPATAPTEIADDGSFVITAVLHPTEGMTCCERKRERESERERGTVQGGAGQQ